MKTLTTDQLEAHLKDPSKCPFCRSDDIVGGPVSVCGDQCEQTVDCYDCDARWIDIYVLHSVQVETEPVE